MAGGPIWETSVTDDVDGTSDSLALARYGTYRITATTDLWFMVDAAGPAAKNTAGSHLLKSGQEILVYVPDASTNLYYIQDSAAGQICASKVSKL